MTDDGSVTLFIGLGMMGAPMARCYARGAVAPLAVFDANVDAARALAVELNATAISTLADISAEDLPIGTVILMLPNSTIVESVLAPDDPNGLLQRLPYGALVIDMGSSEPTSTRRLAAAAAAVGVDYVDAPVSGGVVKAESGELAILMGGDNEQARTRARRHVAPLSAGVIEMGPSGSGHAAKALNNWLSAANIAAASEVLAVAAQAGIAPATMIEALNLSTGRSQASEFKFPKFILTGTYDSQFAFDLMLKDLRIGAQLAEEFSTYTPVLTTVLNTVTDTRELLNSASLDHTEIARFYERKNDLSFSDRS